MKLETIIRDLNVIESNALPETEITGISYNSRTTKPGNLFVAVKGFNSDGHKYIPAAVANGAAAVLCEEIPETEIPYIRIKNTREGLALSSNVFFGYPAGKMRIIGITGTNGKTTTSYLIKHMLERELNAKVGLVGTNGNMIGSEHIHSERTTPESYELYELFRRMADAGCDYVVMEVSSHSLVLDRVAGIHFAAAVYTNLTQDHLDFHGTMENYADAKKLLFSRCDTACFNLDDSWSDYMRTGLTCRELNYSAEDRGAALKASGIKLTAGGVNYKLNYAGEVFEVSLAIPGMFSVHNSLGVIAAGLACGLQPEQCVDALRDASGVKGRVEVVPTDGDYAVLIDYAHTPDALENVLKTLKPLTRGRLIALFGCGGDRDRTKRPIMGAIGEAEADYCIVTSDNPRTEEPSAIIADILTGMKPDGTPKAVIPDRIEAIHYALDMALPGDVIVLAGKGHEDYQEINHVKHHMDEREIVAGWLAQRVKA